MFVKGERWPNRLAVIADFVRAGGGLLMVGGYMSFSGFEGRGRYSLTPLAQVLPVQMLVHDDRIEAPQGVIPSVDQEHDILSGIEGEWPYLLGYNRFRAKPDASIIMSVDGDPLLVVDGYGAGRVAAFASDCSPHWGSPEFMALKFTPGCGLNLWAGWLGSEALCCQLLHSRPGRLHAASSRVVALLRPPGHEGDAVVN